MRLAMLAGVTRALAGPKRAYPDPLPGSHDVCFADNPLPAGIEPQFPPRAAAWERRARAKSNATRALGTFTTRAAATRS